MASDDRSKRVIPDYAPPAARVPERTSRIVGLTLAAVYTVTFAFPIVAAGHGVAPIGLILLLGWPGWATHLLLGWAGLLCLWAGQVMRSRARCGARLLACIGLGGSFTLFVIASELPTLTLVLGIPFIALTILLLVMTASDLRR